MDDDQDGEQRQPCVQLAWATTEQKGGDCEDCGWAKIDGDPQHALARVRGADINWAGAGRLDAAGQDVCAQPLMRPICHDQADEPKQGEYQGDAGATDHLTSQNSIAVEFLTVSRLGQLLPGRLNRAFLMASGDGNDRLSIKGGGGQVHVAAGNGNDTITILGDALRVDGGSGIDTVSLPSARANYRVQQTSSGYSLTDTAGAVNTLVNVERLAFSDATVALDITGNGGQAYRLYQAAFNRPPIRADWVFG